MKKVGIVTFHQALNYGAVLQAFALQNYISCNFTDVQAQIVDYRCEKLSGIYTLKNSRQNALVKGIKAAHFLLKKAKFDAFTKKYIALSRKQYTAQTIGEADGEYDLFLTGSDQVWNPHLSDSDLNYLLQFTSPDKRYSYAASIGLGEIPQELQNVYKALLQDYKGISVREADAKEVLKAIGLQNEIRVHIDPTLLLDRQNWIDVCKGVSPRKKGYVLVYSVTYSEDLLCKAVEFAKDKGLDVLYIGQRTKNKDVHYIPSIKIDRLLALFRDAEYVFENSFHGTVFSVIFHRKFYALLPFSDGRNSRTTNLLSILELQSRAILDNIGCGVDWNKVDAKLQEERRASQEYLEWVIKHEN